MEYFTINKNKKYIIYGAGGGAKKIVKILLENKYTVLGYIDKRAKYLVNIDGKPVWTIEMVKNSNIDKDKTVIIVSTKNVFEHQEIASQLAGIGFRNSIYKPYKILQGEPDKYLERVNEAHDAFLVKLNLPMNTTIPCTKKGIDIELVDKFIINRDKSKVTAWMPIELIFNYKKATVYNDLNMTSFFPMIDLYKALLGNNTIPIEKGLENYINFTSEWVKQNELKMTSDFRESLISSRIKVFGEMQKLSDIDRNFFIRNAPLVNAEDGIHFNLISSGRNRVSFLIAKQNKYVPVKINIEDYKNWINNDILCKVIDFMNEHKIMKFFSPIPHPKLINIPVRAVDYIRLFVMEVGIRINRQLYKKSCYQDEELRLIDIHKKRMEKDKMSVLCAINDEGTISRFLASMGYRIFRSNNQSETEKRYIKLLDRLLYAENKYINNIFTIDKNNDFFYWCIIDNDRTEEEMDYLLSRTYNTAYVLIYDQESINIQLWKKRGFIEVNIMFRTIWDLRSVIAIELKKNRKEGKI